MYVGKSFPLSRITLQFAPLHLQPCPKKRSSTNAVGDLSRLWDSNSSAALLMAASAWSLQCEEILVSSKQKKKKGISRVKEKILRTMENSPHLLPAKHRKQQW